MEGEGDIPAPERGAGGGSMGKIIAAIVVIILVVAAIAGALLFMGGEAENEGPTASASVSSSLVVLGDAVTFDGSDSTDTDGEIVEWEWHFGDGEVDNATGPTVSHNYSHPGEYYILLTVTDDGGAKDSNWNGLLNVEVTPPTVEEMTNDTLPYALSAASEQVVASGTAVELDAASSSAYSVEPTYESPIMMDGQGNYIGWDPVTNSSGYITEWNETGEDTVITGWTMTVNETGWIVNWEPQITPNAVAWTGEMGTDFIKTLTWNFDDGSDPVTGTFSDEAIQNHTYTGDGEIYSTYVEVMSTHNVKQRYYTTVVVLPADAGPSTGIKNPNTFVVATIGEPSTLDPAVDYETAGGEILQNCYETLIWYDGASAKDLKPMLATEVPTVENGGISEDGMNYTFHIREGVMFHDGTEMTVQDVEYSIERVLTMNNPEGPVWMFGQIMIESYPGPGEILDPAKVDDAVTVNATANTVTIHLTQPYPAFLQVMAYTIGDIVSMDYVEDHGGVEAAEGGSENEWMINHVMGTGPYKLVEWVPNQYILLERHDQYWQEPAEMKYVIIKKVQDVGTREMMLFSGDADSVYIPRQQTDDVRGKEDLTIVEGEPTFNMDFIGFNLNISEGLDTGDVSADFFTDMNIRRAFVHSFNYTTFLDDIMQGTAMQPNGPIPLGMFAYDSSIPNYTYNPDLAVQFLENATNPATNDSYAEDGFHVILYYNAGNLVREAACQLLAQGLEGLDVPGEITVEFQALDWPSYLDALYGSELPIFFLGWAPDYADPDDYVNPFLHSHGAFPYFLSIDNATLDSMIEDAAAELNETVRKDMYHNISEACYNNAYYIWTGQATQFHVERSWVNGYYFNPMYSGLYYYALSKG